MIVDEDSFTARPAQAGHLTTKALEWVQPGNPWVNMDTGSSVQFYVAPEPLDLDKLDDPFFEPNLQATMLVTANRHTGYGSLHWNNYWHPINADPPTDPRVVLDPYVPNWVRPEHVLPLDLVKQGLREFVRTEGAQPSCIEWVRIGELSRVGLMPDEYRSVIPTAA